MKGAAFVCLVEPGMVHVGGTEAGFVDLQGSVDFGQHLIPVSGQEAVDVPVVGDVIADHHAAIAVEVFGQHSYLPQGLVRA